jgi:hypothetical protein
MQQDYSDNIRMESHSHFSDKSKQNASTTHTHMEVLLNYLKGEGYTVPGATMWDDTDGCSKKYRRGTAIYLPSVLAVQFGISIDRLIGAPGHG